MNFLKCCVSYSSNKDNEQNLSTSESKNKRKEIKDISLKLISISKNSNKKYENPFQKVAISKDENSSTLKELKEKSIQNEENEHLNEVTKKQAEIKIENTNENQIQNKNKNININIFDKSNENHEENKEDNIKFIQLEIIEGPEMIKGTKLILNEKGIENGKPNIHEGFTYFGYKTTNTDFIVDYSFPPQKGLSSTHFYIRFDKKTKKFYIRDMSPTFGTYWNVDGPLKLKANHILAVGESRFKIQAESKLNWLRILEIKFYCSGKPEETHTFDSSQSPINIGRSEKCKLSVDLKSISRYQCILEYKGNVWNLNDGDGSKPSTNGTWLLISEEMEIRDNMIVRAGETNIKFKT